ncbi:MAG TPA: hypothetical protein VN150_15480 [Ochrobactrum sp.]|nr:hypothetical protein [Ochrobactrum sp.]
MADLRLRINELPEELAPAPIDNIAIDGPTTRRTTLSRVADAVRPYSTEVMAREGLNNASSMTPLGVSQAIETLGGERFATAQQGNRADTAVQPTRSVLAGEGLSGGGTLASNITLALSSTALASLALANSAVQPARQVIAGAGLSGGGSLAADRTFSLSAGALASLLRADTAVQAPGGLTGQILVKNSALDNDVSWKEVSGVTAVSYGPQSLTSEQQEQARLNIGSMPVSATIKSTPVDNDGFALSDSADGGKPKRTLWSSIKSTLGAIFYNKTEVNNIVAGNMAGRAYPRRADGQSINFNGGGVVAGQPPALIGGGWDGNFNNFYFYTTTNLTVGWANGATYAERLGAGGWTLAEVQNQLNWRLTDTRFDGYIENNLTIPETGNFAVRIMGASGYVVASIWTFAPRNIGVALRQPQIYIPNVGWRAQGSW